MSLEWIRSDAMEWEEGQRNSRKCAISFDGEAYQATELGAH